MYKKTFMKENKNKIPHLSMNQLFGALKQKLNLPFLSENIVKHIIQWEIIKIKQGREEIHFKKFIDLLNVNLTKL